MKRTLLIFLALFIFSECGLLLGQTVTPNIGLQIPLYNQPNWQVPINYDLNRLDLLLGGQLPLPFLNPTRLQFAPVYFSAVPTCTSQLNGTVYGVLDSTTNVWGATITGSGGLLVWAYCNGTNWVVAPSGAGGGPTGLTNPMTTFGDAIYGGLSGLPTRLAGNTTNTPMYWKSQGSGGVASAPTLTQIQFADIVLPTGAALVCNGVTVFCASAYSGDMGQQYTSALAAAYAVGGGTVLPGSLVCPAQCHVGTANLVLGDGIHNVNVYLPMGVITRDTISATGLSAQILYNSTEAGKTTINAYGTTTSGPSDVCAVAQYPSGSPIAKPVIYGLAINDTGSVVQGSAAFCVGGPAIGGIPAPASPNVSYTTNVLENVKWPGNVAHYALYPAALTAAQVLNHYNVGITPGTGYIAAVEADSPYAYWTFGDTSGTTAVAAVGGSGLNATYSGGVTLGSVASIPGDSAHDSAQMDGTTGQVTFPAYNYFSSPSWSLEGWAYATTNVDHGLFDFIDPIGSNELNFADFSIEWGGMYLYHKVSGTVLPRTVFAQTSLTQGAWTHFVYTYNGASGTLLLYLNGQLARVGTDVSDGSFYDMTVSGADYGTELNSQHGNISYNKFYSLNSGGLSAGIATLNNSGFGGGCQSNAWYSSRPSGAIAIYDSCGDKNTYDGVPDFELNVSATGLAAFAEPTIGYLGANYVKGDVITVLASCTTNPTFKVLYTGATGDVASDASQTEQTLQLVSPGLGCAQGTTGSLSVSGGSGTGLKVNLHVSGHLVLNATNTMVINAYEEAGAFDWICGGGSFILGPNAPGYNANYCPGTSTPYWGPATSLVLGPGTPPRTWGISDNEGYISWYTNQLFDPLQSFSYIPTITNGRNMYQNQVTWNGQAAQSYGHWGTANWYAGLQTTYSGTNAFGKTTFGKIADPAVPVLTAVGGTGTVSAAYGLVGSDAATGHTIVSSPVTTVSGPATLGALLTVAVANGGASYPNSGTATLTGGDGTGTVNFTAVGGVVQSVTINTAGSTYNTRPFIGSSVTNIFNTTTGGSGTGLTVKATSSYIAVTLPHVNGIASWTVLIGDTAHKLQLPGTNVTGALDVSSEVDDFGGPSVSATWSSTANTTGQFSTQNNTLDDGAGNASFAGNLNLATGKGFTINNAAASGHYLRGNGTAYVDSAIQLGDLPVGTATELSGVSGSIGGSPLTVGQTVTGTASITGASAAVTAGAVIDVTPVTQGDPGLGFTWQGYMSGTDTVTVVVTCVAASATPTATTYNVKVIK